MSQASPTIGANKSGLVYRQEDNDGKKALLTHHKGPAAPSYAEAGMLWLDDSATPWAFKCFDGADWITIGTLHAGQNVFMPYLGSSALRLVPYAADTGSINAFNVAPAPAPPAHQTGQIIAIKPAYSINGAASLNLGDLDGRDVRLADGSTTAEGDMIAGQLYLLIYEGSYYVLINPSRNASVPTGTTVASQSVAYSTYAATSAIIPFDNTIPQASEGMQILSLSHTPAQAGNRIRLRFSAFGSSSNQSIPIVAFLSIDGGPAVQAAAVHTTDSGQIAQICFEHEYTVDDAASHTYAIRVGPGGAASIRLNGSSSSRLFGGTAAARLVLEEIKA